MSSSRAWDPGATCVMSDQFPADVRFCIWHICVNRENMFNVILNNTEKLSTQNKLFGAKNETIEKDVDNASISYYTDLLQHSL